MSEVGNEDRREWARLALDTFGEQTGQTGYDYADPEALQEIAGDLVCDVLHLAAAAGLAADAVIEVARGHFDAETNDDLLYEELQRDAHAADCLRDRHMLRTEARDVARHGDVSAAAVQRWDAEWSR